MDADLTALAEAHGVATWYEDWHRERREVSEESVRKVLELLGEGKRQGTVIATEGDEINEQIRLEDGTEHRGGPLPLGYHSLDNGDTLIVVPEKLPEPPQTWGWMLQLYAMHSAKSWGIGDLADLRTFIEHQTEAGLILLNPLHAITPTLPVPSSPYSPSSRRFVNPLYLRIEDIPEYGRADARTKQKIDALRPPATELIDYSAVWQAKRDALELLWPLAGEADRDADPGLTDFAVFCTLAERHGPNWQTWPAELRRPDTAEVAAARDEPRVAFHIWVQHLVNEQLDAANRAAAGMPVGVVHDLAVGIDPSGADGWLLQDVLAAGVHAGAPPDAFNQLGQDWGLAAWRPDRLVETGYAAYRDMLRRIFRHTGGLRVDHILGLWRLWWVPPGMGPAEGTYVHYDPEAMLGILALEAHRAGAVVIGEDLGTVLKAVTQGLKQRNILGSAILYFTRDWDDPDDVFYPAEDYPSNALASISTHDLPTAAGFLTGEQVRVRAELGQLAGSVSDERRRAESDRAQLLAALTAEGLITPDSDDEEIIVAMHEFLARTPCRFVTASLYDVLGVLDQPNLPGTTDEYPNWRMPLPTSLEQIVVDPRVRRIVAVLGARKSEGTAR